MKVKYLEKSKIENDALNVIHDFNQKFTPITQPPVPVDEILENQLKLVLNITNLKQKFGYTDVLGATFVADHEVHIDESLDPDKSATSEGRFHFTIGHEIGHWILHKHYYPEVNGQESFFEKKPTVLCRESQRKDPQEWQADYFASCLLLPREMVLREWDKKYGNRNPIYADDAYKRVHDSNASEYDLEEIMNGVAAEFNRIFRVSKQAMRIRLETMGLMKKENPGELIFQ